MILELNKELVEKTADYIESFFPQYYGSIPATLLEKEPFKYKTKVVFDDKVKGVLSYSSNIFNHVNVKLLAGDEKSMAELLKHLEYYNDINIAVPVKLSNYIESLKKIGFEESGNIISKDLNEDLVKLILIPLE